MTSNPPPGWYPDPNNEGSERYWNGSSWDTATRAAQAPYPQQGGYQQPQYGQSQWGEQGGGYQPTSVMGQNDPYGAPTPQTPPPSSSGRRWVLPVVIGVVCLLVGGGVGFAIGHSNGSSGSGNQADGSAATSAGPTSTSQTGAPQSGTAQSGAPQTSSAPSTTPAPTSSAPTGPTFTVNGTMTLVDPNASYSQGSTCNGSLGYNDITKGAQVTVTDPGGSTLATGELQEGQAQDSTTCLFHFSVAQVPEQSAYGIEVSNRGVVDESLDEMRQGVALELGDR